MNAYPSLQVFTTEAGSKTKMCLLLKPGGGNVLLNLSNTEQKINEEPRLLRALREGEDTRKKGSMMLMAAASTLGFKSSCCMCPSRMQ